MQSTFSDSPEGIAEECYEIQSCIGSTTYYASTTTVCLFEMLSLSPTSFEPTQIVQFSIELIVLMKPLIVVRLLVWLRRYLLRSLLTKNQWKVVWTLGVQNKK